MRQNLHHARDIGLSLETFMKTVNDKFNLAGLEGARPLLDPFDDGTTSYYTQHFEDDPMATWSAYDVYKSTLSAASQQSAQSSSSSHAGSYSVQPNSQFDAQGFPLYPQQHPFYSQQPYYPQQPF
jgi:hypothetical protein